MQQLDQMRNPTEFICPRCEGLIPCNDKWGEYPGAISRLTRGEDDESLEICSDCGTDEALQDFSGVGITPAIQYPITSKDATNRRFEAIMIIERHNEKVKHMNFHEKIRNRENLS